MLPRHLPFFPSGFRLQKPIKRTCWRFILRYFLYLLSLFVNSQGFHSLFHWYSIIRVMHFGPTPTRALVPEIRVHFQSRPSLAVFYCCIASVSLHNISLGMARP